MKIAALEKIFPVKKGLSDHPESAITFTTDGEQYYMNKTDLTPREISLFNTVLFATKEMRFDQLSAGVYRLIQLKSDSFDEISEHLSLIFPTIITVEKQASDYGVAIEKLSPDCLYESEMKQTLATLFQDLGVDGTYYLGMFYDQAVLADRYQLEKSNFEQGLTFSEALIKAGIKQVSSHPLSIIKQRLLTDSEAQELIKKLYQNDSNQLQTAKAMFIHRNTLTQKMKKFERQYGLTLTGSDLVLLYSLINIADK
ncbi:helix-turn-helix domain-containing protein [Lactococcus carnosus]|uniref:Polyketide synthase regulator n=1 Tax=Pseudolactococcus carnosus TaxID=2749961 RepID=A0ABT0APL9_9LACT|nr:helix-turn-helix domain-containing protein [Lactococcus carnosus]MCJ1988616.1 polyketide synthase regulator [Lactococcus carnosus]